tara:strand:+ start:293 stop:616 length:324 start_codon:yes stop_codon:yes gene_type:complete
VSFLDNTTQVVDAVLTKKGRERLSQNNFNIIKFGLGDDEIDYGLWNEANSGGPNFYGIILDNMPIQQAFLNNLDALKYNLTTLELDTNVAPIIADESVPAEIIINLG